LFFKKSFFNKSANVITLILKVYISLNFSLLSLLIETVEILTRTEYIACKLKFKRHDSFEINKTNKREPKCLHSTFTYLLLPYNTITYFRHHTKSNWNVIHVHNYIAMNTHTIFIFVVYKLAILSFNLGASSDNFNIFETLYTQSKHRHFIFVNIVPFTVLDQHSHTTPQASSYLPI
jgi:hypothetical protein